MANRKSWRRAVAPTTVPPRASSKSVHPAFQGVSDPPLTALLTALISRDVTLRTLDNHEYSGLFAGSALASTPDKSLVLHLRFARSTHGDFSSQVATTDVRAGVARTLSVPMDKVKEVKARKPFGQEKKNTFVTDSHIARGGGGVGRTLQRFEEFSNVPARSLKGKDEQTFGDMALNGGGNWDQFQANEVQFGVVTTFDEDEYTTKIDRADSNYQQREREAARLAEEIEAKTSDNVHMREERNQDLGADYDEETLYSGVVRPGAPNNRPSSVRAPVHASHNTRHNSGRRPVSVPAKKEYPIETKRLSYAAAAASSVKASANMNGSTANLNGSTANVKNSQHTTSAPKQAGKASPPTDNKSGLNRSSSAVTSASSGEGKSAAHTKSNAGHKGSSTNKMGKNLAGDGKNNTSGSGKQKSFGRYGSGNTLDSKERELVEKKLKNIGSRDRSSRDNLPQLVKVRSSITGRTSPSQSRNSPLPTPATADSSAVAVLNLDGQTAKPEQVKSFVKYKTMCEIQSIAQNREKITDDLRKFSTSLDSRNGSLRRNNSSNTNNVVSAEKKGSDTSKVDEKSPATKVAEPKASSKRVDRHIAEKEEEATVNKTESTPPVKTADIPAQVKPKETGAKPKSKLKSKLNPNAQEFKMNPDAPEFTPSFPDPPQMNHPPPAPYSPFGVPPVMPEYSQPVPSAPQAPYAVPVQAMGQVPYGQPAYGVLMPGAVPTPVAPPTSAYQFVPPVSFPTPNGPAPFPPQAVPVSYGYRQMNPSMPMVAQAPQRMPSGPYGYYNSGPYPGQVAGGPQMAAVGPPPQQMFLPAHQAGMPHMGPGGMNMGNRGGHGGHTRRGGGGRRGGKHHSHGMGGPGGMGSVEHTGHRRSENGAATDPGPR